MAPRPTRHRIASDGVVPLLCKAAALLEEAGFAGEIPRVALLVAGDTVGQVVGIPLCAEVAARSGCLRQRADVLLRSRGADIAQRTGRAVQPRLGPPQRLRLGAGALRARAARVRRVGGNGQGERQERRADHDRELQDRPHGGRAHGGPPRSGLEAAGDSPKLREQRPRRTVACRVAR